MNGAKPKDRVRFVISSETKTLADPSAHIEETSSSLSHETTNEQIECESLDDADRNVAILEKRKTPPTYISIRRVTESIIWEQSYDRAD